MVKTTRSWGLTPHKPTCLGSSILFLILVLSSAAVAIGQPARHGVTSFFPLHVLWSAPLGAPSNTAPVTDGKRIFFGLRTGTVRALQVDSGAPVWNATLDLHGPLAAD